MEKVYSINEAIAPKDYKDFCKWYKTACNLPYSAKEAWVELLGRKYEDKPVKKEVE